MTRAVLGFIAELATALLCLAAFVAWFLIFAAMQTPVPA